MLLARISAVLGLTALLCAALAAQGVADVDEQHLQALRWPTGTDELVKFLSLQPAKELQGDGLASAARLLAKRRAATGVEPLLDCSLHVDQAVGDQTWVRDEVLTALGRLAFAHGKADPALLRALDDPTPARRATAAYVLGRRGSIDERGRLRRLLADPDAGVRKAVAEGLVGKSIFETLRDAAAADEALLRQHKVELNETALLDFLRKRTLDDADQKRLQRLVRELGNPLYSERDRAARQLIEEGTPALVFVRPAEHAPDIEVARRAQHCAEMIRRGPGPGLPTAAIHMLANPQAGRAGGEALQTLLAYVPFADDDTVEDAVLATATLLSLREPKLDPALTRALGDPLPARRAAAAYVLGHVGGREQHSELRRLLDDVVPQVRLRAAQGLLAAQDSAAVPHLVALVGELPGSLVWRAEDMLCRLAGEEAPGESVGGASGAARDRAVVAWQQWWQHKGPGVDLGRLGEQTAYLGLVSVAEYDSALGQPGGRVWEATRDGKPRWFIKGLQGAMDAHVLPTGRVLIAENSALRVTERDLDGNVKWEHRLQGNPICCQRLANGNTFIALYNQVLEVKPTHEEVYRYTPGPQFYIFSAHKTRKGNIVAMTAQGAVIELDGQTGKQLRPPLQVGANGNWCGIETLPNGNFLVALLSSNEVREVTPEGNIVWKANYRGAFRATRLPNGHTIVASMIDRKVAELDRAGSVRWERACEGRPWSVHYR